MAQVAARLITVLIVTDANRKRHLHTALLSGFGALVR